MQWDLITNIILIAAIVTLGLFVCLGLYQWVTRKSFKKIDPELRWAIVPIVLMAITYFVFDHFLILNTRPDGSGEPSFPSSHVMLVATTFFLTAIILPRYVAKQSHRIFIDILMLALLVLVSVGRVLANKHWTSDVEGALLFSLIFATIYYLILRSTTYAKHLHQNHKR
ncbi:phosphatase PAP2 family protein [Candidatus Saccharibacteria bacterium]|nr:phosphatase PAP2 family protein [Candidatus Saccharibacteria bacterium]